MQKKTEEIAKNEIFNESELTKMQFMVGETPYLVPICWEAITFGKYLEWINEWVDLFPNEQEMISGEHESSDIEYPIRMLSFQTDIPIDVLKNCSISGIEQIKQTQMFWFDFKTLNDKHINHVKIDVDIDDAPVKFMIEFVHAAKNNDKQPINLAPELIKNYFGVDILDKPLVKYYGLATFFLSKSASIGLKYRHKYQMNHQAQKKLRQVLKCFPDLG